MSRQLIALFVLAMASPAPIMAAPVEAPSLLSSLLRQTLYARMKNLLLDHTEPLTPTAATAAALSSSSTSTKEQQLIVEAAVENSRRQRQPQELHVVDTDFAATAARGGQQQQQLQQEGQRQERLQLTKLAGAKT